MSGVVTYHSDQSGSPIMDYLNGSMISVLDACLVNGYGLVSFDSLVQVGGVATATRSVGMTFKKDDTILIEGASPAGWNGKWRVTSVTTTTATFTVDSSLASPATGTISAKIPSLGWTKLFSATNKAVYQSSDVNSTGACLRVDESMGNSLGFLARISMYATMTDVDTGTGLCPASGGLNWCKSISNLGGGRPWRLIGDERAFYLFTDPSAYQDGRSASYFFGDIIPVSSDDEYAACIFGHYNNESAGNYEGNMSNIKFVDGNTTFNQAGRFMLRSYNGVSSSYSFRLAGHLLADRIDNGPVPFPNPAGGGLLLSKIVVFEGGTSTLRGVMPGIYQSYHYAPLAHLDTVTNTIDGTPRKVVGYQAGGTTSIPRGIVPFDTTGPWR